MNERRLENKWAGPCPICGAVGWERWPHPEGEPCPQKLKVDEAYIAMMDAQRMSFLRTGVTVEGLNDLLHRMADTDE